MRHEISRRELIGKLGAAGGVAGGIAVGLAAWPTTAAAQRSGLPSPAGLPVFDVRSFGAAGDGTTLNTGALQAAVDACAASGGGTVFFPAGRFLTGGLALKSHVALETSPGTVVLGSPRLADYPVHHPKLASRTREYVQHALLYGEDLDDVAILGPGTFDGQGGEFHKHFGGDYLKRPYLVRLVDCRDVRVADVTLKDSAMWTMHLLGCRRARVDGVRIWAHVASNNDGIDIDACEDVAVDGCLIDSGDDAIVLKSTLHRPSRNIVVTNCVLASQCNAIKMGTESLGGFINVALSNCVIRSPRQSRNVDAAERGISAISLETVDGARLERVTISGLIIDGVEAAIFLRLGDRANRLEADEPRPAPGTHRGVSISHVVGENIGRTGCSIVGIPGHPVVDVSLDDVSLRFAGDGTREQAAQLDVPEKERDYPESTMFGILPAYGLYARHVRNLRLRGLDLGFAAPDARPPLVLEDVAGLEVSGLAAETGPETDCLMRMRGVRDALVHGCRLKGPVKSIADADAACRNIRWAANAFDVPDIGPK